MGVAHVAQKEIRIASNRRAKDLSKRRVIISSGCHSWAGLGLVAQLHRLVAQLREGRGNPLSLSKKKKGGQRKPSFVSLAESAAAVEGGKRKARGEEKSTDPRGRRGSVAAALRHAARRLGGSARAVAEEQQRRLFSPRLIHTKLQSNPARLSRYEEEYIKVFARQLQEKNVPTLPRYEEEYEEYALRLVQQKKEELYDALFDARRYANTWPDRHLLKTLSLHVNHRPDDPHWRRMSRNRKLFTWIGSVWVVFVSVFLSTHKLEGGVETK